MITWMALLEVSHTFEFLVPLGAVISIHTKAFSKYGRSVSASLAMASRIISTQCSAGFYCRKHLPVLSCAKTDTSYTKSLQKALSDTEKAIGNLMRTIELGIFNVETKNRMDELVSHKSELKSALAAAKLKEDLGLKKESIKYFLHQFSTMDYSDIACKKRLIITFVNSVYVYDDKVVLTFNYSGDGRTITLNEIDAGLEHGVRLPSMLSHHEYCAIVCARSLRRKISPR